MLPRMSSSKEGMANGIRYQRDQINKKRKHPFHMAVWRCMYETIFLYKGNSVLKAESCGENEK